MHVSKKIMVEKEEIHKFCDDCGVEIRIGLACGKASCTICGADLCNNCVGHEYDDGSDYRTTWCRSCWEIGAPYREKIQKLREECDKLHDEWRMKGKAARGKSQRPEQEIEVNHGQVSR